MDMKQYAAVCQPRLRQLIRDLCAIPAPSHYEQRRAAFCRDWFYEHCSRETYVDKALNVICPWGVTEDGPVIAVMAHTDTVFPEETPLTFYEDERQFRCPGVTDDTAQLAVLMMCAEYLMKHCPVPKTGVLFVANSCEEGLGNLKGCRAIIDSFGERMTEFITIDGTSLHRMVDRAVGSHRWRVTVKTEGGHSFNAFGNTNAIHELSRIIRRLYEVNVPEKDGTKTTYNVGTVSGGTSVNTIAQSAEMLFEYRSDDRECLHNMEQTFSGIIEDFRKEGLQVQTERIGERPCGAAEPEGQKLLRQRAADAILRVTGLRPEFVSGSTDCNIPLSVGIPAICLGACVGGNCHTTEEYLELDSLETGCRLVLDFLYHTLYT